MFTTTSPRLHRMYAYVPAMVMRRAPFKIGDQVALRCGSMAMVVVDVLATPPGVSNPMSIVCAWQDDLGNPLEAQYPPAALYDCAARERSAKRPEALRIKSALKPLPQVRKAKPKTRA